MASLDKPTLRIDADVVGPNPTATLTIGYTVHWDAYDQASRQEYREGWKIIGADSAGGEDGTDDTITGMGAATFVWISSDGSASSEHEIVVELDFDELDEDPGSNLDEIKAEDSLTPRVPARVAETSNRVLVSA